MPLFVFRKHVIPVGELFINAIYDWYKEGLKENGVLPSSFNINFLIRKKWRREDVWNEVTFHIEVPSLRIQDQAMLSDSMDQFWIDKKPEGCFEVLGTLNYSNMKCSICLERSGDKIRLYNCNCIYHKDCIELCVKYGKSCPKCFKTINMNEKFIQTCSGSVNVNEKTKTQ